MTEKTESRPRISAAKDAMVEVRAFADRFDLDRDDVYGKGIEDLAKRLKAEDQEAVANEIRE